MKEVAKHLHAHALANFANSDAALYVKSACNRYYYTVYLTLRDEVFNILDNTKRFPHGSDASKAIHGSYKRQIKERLVSHGYSLESELVENLVNDLIKKFVCLYDIREESDYYTPNVKIDNADATIEFYKKSKNQQYKLSEIEITAYEVINIISQLEVYRKMAGFI